LVTYLPSATQANLPPFLLPSAEEHDSTLDSQIVTPPSAIQKEKGKKSRDNTPRDSPAATEAESDDDEEVVGENGDATAAKKKKKPGLGKAGGARRRKMAMK
jgi:hypothetical protein